MAKYWGTPPFFTQFFFIKMTQNGLKWTLNKTSKMQHFEKIFNFFKASLM